MPSAEKRLEKIMDDLSPEEKCALLLEDEWLHESALSDSERRQLMAMDQEEARRYKEYLDLFEHLRCDVSSMMDSTQKLLVLLLSRDRILWYIGGLTRCQEALTYDPTFTPERPLEVQVPFVSVALGSSEQARGVELSPAVIEVLDSYAKRICEMAREVKALHSQVTQQAGEMGLKFIRELADSTVEQVRNWDQPSLGAIMEEIEERREQWDKEGLSEGEMVDRILDADPKPRGMGVFPVEERWELDWNSLEEDQ